MLVTRLRYLVILDNINQGCNFADHHALGLDLQGLSGFEKWIWPFVDAAHDHDTIEEQLFNLSTHWCIFLHWLAHLEQRWDTLIYLFNGHQLEWGSRKKSIFWQAGLGSHAVTASLHISYFEKKKGLPIEFKQKRQLVNQTYFNGGKNRTESPLWQDFDRE